MPTYTGYKKSLKVTVGKFFNGMMEGGYPKTYDGLASFTFDTVVYPVLNPLEFASLTDEEYNTRLTAFKGYIALQEGLITIDPYITTLPVIFDNTLCPNGALPM